MAVPPHASTPRSLTMAVGALMFVLLAGYGTMVEYSPAASADSPASAAGAAEVTSIAPMLSDVSIMLVIGFGFLMTYLKKHGFFSTGMSMFVTASIVLWSMLALGVIEHWYNGHDGRPHIYLSVSSLVLGNFAAATVLVTLGIIIGKVTPTQLLCCGVIEIIFYALNEQILVQDLKIADVGGSMVIHAFGAYFGLGVSAMSAPRAARTSPNNSSVYHSDMFAMIGTLFLWAFWPSFNSVFAGDDGGARNRTIVNTVLSLCGSCVAAFWTSQHLRGGRFDMVDIQNATLAGGVAIGSSANLMLTPVVAILIGFFGGVLSTGGFASLGGWLENKFGLQDTAGAHNLHGLPGVYAAIVAAFAALAIDSDKYLYGSPYPDSTRSNATQFGYQLAALFVTLAIALSSGALTGYLINLPLGEKLEHYFHDGSYFHMPGEEEEQQEQEHAGAADDDEEAATGSIAMAPLDGAGSSSNNILV